MKRLARACISVYIVCLLVCVVCLCVRFVCLCVCVAIVNISAIEMKQSKTQIVGDLVQMQEATRKNATFGNAVGSIPLFIMITNYIVLCVINNMSMIHWDCEVELF